MVIVASNFTGKPLATTAPMIVIDSNIIEIVMILVLSI